jgi:hypothetical protein
MHRQLAVTGREAFETPDVAYRTAGGEVAAVSGRERVGIPLVQQPTAFLTEPVDQRIGEVVVPVS